MTPAARVVRLVRAPSPVDGRFAVASVVDAIGTGCFLAGSALFFTGEVGLTAGQVGVGLTLSGVVGLVATPPWGRAADRWGARRTVVVLLLARALAFLLYTLVASFAAFLAVAAFLGFVEKASAPVQQTLLGEMVAADRRQRAMAIVRSTRNVGFALGALIAASLSSLPALGGYDAVVAVNAATFTVAAVLVATIRAGGARSSATRREPARSQPLRDRRYLALTAVNGVLTLHMSLLSVGLPLWLVEHTSGPVTLVPALLVVNTVLAVVLQVPVAGRVRSSRDAARALALAGAGIAACCLALALAPRVDGVAVVAVALAAMLGLTAAELTQAAAGWDLSFRLAPESRRGHYLGVFSLGVTAQTIVGPLLLTGVVFACGGWGWAALAGAAVAVGLLASPALRSDPREMYPGAAARGSHSETTVTRQREQLPMVKRDMSALLRPEIPARRRVREVSCGVSCGTLGELYQGPYWVQSEPQISIVSLPVAKYSWCYFIRDDERPDTLALDLADRPKSIKAARLFLERYGRSLPGGRWQIHSELSVGKGMASSTADIVATLRCLYNVFGLAYDQSVVTEILRHIERTDTVFLDEFALYLSAHHRVVASLGDRIVLHTCYVVEDAVVDTDGVTDHLLRDYRSRAARYRSCLSELVDAFRSDDARGVARGATASALLSQDVVPKQCFDDVIANQRDLGADGVFVAHTGSIIGYLFRAQPRRTQMDELSAFFRSLGSQCAFAKAGWGHA
jgi:uncharacterized protein involved in propanediol utilization/MFS family permease